MEDGLMLTAFLALINLVAAGILIYLSFLKKKLSGKMKGELNVNERVEHLENEVFILKGS